MYLFFFFRGFVYFLLAVLSHHSCSPAFSGCSEQGPPFRWHVQASHCGGGGPLLLWSTGSRTHGLQEFIFVVDRLRCPMACGIFPDQGLNPFPLHWQAIPNCWTTWEVPRRISLKKKLIEVELIYSVVLISVCCTAKWFSYTYMYILFRCDLSWDIEYSSLCYTVYIYSFPLWFITGYRI